MKRDMRLIRAILQQSEDLSDGSNFFMPEIEGYDEGTTTYHKRLAVKMGLLHVNNQGYVTALTNHGHDALEEWRSKE